MAPRERRRYRGIFDKKTKKPAWSVAITVKGIKYHLGMWGERETAVCAYDWMAIVHLGDSGAKLPRVTRAGESSP